MQVIGVKLNHSNKVVQCFGQFKEPEFGKPC
jgi:hypothetical protein